MGVSLDIFVSLLNVGIVGGADNSHGSVHIIEGQDFLRDVGDALVDGVQALLAPIDVLDDTVVDIRVGLLCLLEGHEGAIEELHLIHLIGAEIDAGLFQATRFYLDRRCCLV